ncbi:MAG TPA: amidohydrolase family protein [Acidimicrobiales bacterium]|jgi:N-acyl-D-aspartate/D-glutamate deacylase|nr:amidohydrolase family protein [Acidimicrobiales bacterium]
MLDTALRGGTVIDGTGRPARTADIGIRDGRIVDIGRIDEPTHTDVDVRDLVVSPGIVDVHTHYDAQLFWDPAATPSCFHGVTTVLGGNCGFTLAPNPGGDYLMRLMARVEGIPLAALEAGLPWDWTTYSDWLDRLDGKIAVNAGFLCGHSALRAFVMGAAATERTATPDEIKAMVRLLHGAIDAGALGFSSSQTVNHNDGDGRPVPSRFASESELLALAGAVSSHAGTSVEWITSGVLHGFSDEEVDLLANVSLAANRPLNWNALGVSRSDPDGHWQRLHACTVAAQRGATVVGLAVPAPVSTRVSFVTGFVIDGIPGWSEVLALPLPERRRALADPAVRRRLAEGFASPDAGLLRDLVDWERVTVGETFADENKQYEGRLGGDIARERGVSALDAILDIVVDDDLRTGLESAPMGDDPETWRMRADTWDDPRVVLGGNDAGAHLDIMCSVVNTSIHLGPTVRDRGLVSLEQAVRQLTDIPARLYGLRGRGRIAPGYWADLMVFDPDRIGAGPVRTVADLPAGASRLYAEATGIHRVLVNGTTVVHDCRLTGDEPGTLLRSGRDTYTVEAGTFSP